MRNNKKSDHVSLFFFNIINIHTQLVGLSLWSIAIESKTKEILSLHCAFRSRMTISLVGDGALNVRQIGDLREINDILSTSQTNIVGEVIPLRGEMSLATKGLLSCKELLLSLLAQTKSYSGDRRPRLCALCHSGA